MINATSIKPALWLLIFIAVGFAVYFSGLAIPRYGDDFVVILDSPSSKIFYFFYSAHPAEFYRPTDASFNAASQTLFGTSTVPIHVVSVLSHALLSWLVYSFMMRLGFRKSQAVLGAFFMLFSQANVHPVLSNDTLAQAWSALFGFLSIWLLFRASAISYALSVLAFALALLSKEAALPFLIIIFGFMVLKKFSGAPKDPPAPTCRITNVLASLKRDTGAMLARLTPYVIVTISYLLIRSSLANIQPGWGSRRYEFNLGLNIIENSAQLFFATLVPASSVTAFVALQSSEWLTFGTITVATAVVLALAVWGIYRLERRGVMYLVGASSLAAFFPVAILNRVSELHAYNAMPFISIIIGAGLGELWYRSGASRSRRALLALFIGLLFASNIYAIQTKTLLMKQSGKQATNVLGALKSRAPDVPAGGELILVNPEKPDIEYSVFLLRGFNILESPREIKRLINRSDITVKIIEAPDLKRIQPKENMIILSTDEEGGVYNLEL
ncbi:MAG: glycosyltransferase family 39 protein [bacterium]|nr:glycosyltransferase family 39 protein [bacterium]